MALGQGIQEREYGIGGRLFLDGKKASLDAEVPEDVKTKDVLAGKKGAMIYTNPAEMIRSAHNLSILPSFSLVRFGKVKNFVDGVKAVAEERMAEKGHPMSRHDFLVNLEAALGEGNERVYVSAARHLGEGMAAGAGPVAAALARFEEEPYLSLVQTFFDWVPGLDRFFRQGKALATPPGFFFGREDDDKFNQDAMERIKEVISEDPELSKAYERMLRARTKLDDKLEEADCILPPISLPDQEFFMELSFRTRSDIPGGLGEALIKAVRSGEVNFKPTDRSGLYTRMMHEITNLITRDTSEFSKWHPNEKFGEIMDQTFVSEWAGTRHTFLGSTNYGQMLIGCAVQNRPPINIYPEIDVEPLATSYIRMAETLQFLRASMVSAFGNDILERKRPRQDGSRAKDTLWEEFKYMNMLLRGVAYAARESIHEEYNPGKNASHHMKLAKDWLESLENDPDMDRNMAIFVPIIRETSGERQIAYVDAGFRLVRLNVSYREKPVVNSPRDGFSSPRYRFKRKDYRLPVLVHKEVRVPYKDIVNDRGLRELLSQPAIPGPEVEAALQKLESP